MISSRLRPRNLNQALAWLLAWVIVPLLLGALVLLVVQSRQAQLLTQNQLSTLAQTLVQAVDRELDYGEAQLEVIAASPVIDGRNWQQLHRFGSDVAGRRPDSLITLVGPDGQMLVNTAVPWGQPLPNLWKFGEERREVLWEGRTLPLSSQNLTREVFERAQVVYSDLYYGVLQRPALALSVPVIREGKVLYALTLSFPPALLQQLIRSAVNAPGFRVVVVDRRGIVVASNAAATASMGDRAKPILVPPGSLAGHYQITAPDGARLRGAYAVSANNGFVVRISLPQAARFVPALTASAGWLVLVIGALAASVLLAGFMGRRLAQPLRELGQAARDGLPPPDGPPTGIAEIDLLAQALRAGAEAERERREEHVLRLSAEQKEALVKDSETRLKRVLDQLFVFVAVLDLEGRLQECNSAPLQRAGVDRGEVLGRHFWECYWWEHDAAVAQQVREAVQQATLGETKRFDAFARFAGGELLTVDLQLAPLRDDAGRITGLIASGVDIEDRVQALRQLERSEARAVESSRRLDAAKRLLEATLEAAPVGIAISDPQGHVLRINQAGAELSGISSAANRNLTIQPLPDRGRSHDTGEAIPLSSEQWPLYQALGQRRAVTSIIDIAPADEAASPRTVLMSAAPVLDAAGDLIGGVVVQVDITKRVKAEAALRLADRQKDEFLATLAHELRNPLAPIRTAVELIRRREPADMTVQRARDIIERQVSHLSRLVDDLLDVSRITLGTIYLQKEMLDLGAVATSAAESVRLTLEAAGLTLEQKIGPLAVTVHGDATRLAQCIVNLLNNAVKFTPRGGHIVLRVAQEGAMASVEVSDTGIGISSRNLERIFELFVQERPSGLHGNTGLGIGLALTRKLMALHGGRVWAESAGPGHGSTFRIELPAASTAAPSPVPGTPAQAMDGAGARVLVVDDNQDAADLLSEMLAMFGFRTSVEYDGEEAVRAVEQQAPDAVLLDIGLVGIDGYEVCRRIRRLGIAKQPVVIALTGWGQEQDRDRASAAGFDAHLTKPAEPARIISLLNELLTKQA